MLLAVETKNSSATSGRLAVFFISNCKEYSIIINYIFYYSCYYYLTASYTHWHV